MRTRLKHRAMVLTVGVALATSTLAQDLADLQGVWIVIDPAEVRQGGGFPERITLQVSADAVTITRHPYGPETYRLDGSGTPLLDNRTGSVRLENGVLSVMRTRERVQRDGTRSMTTSRETFRVIDGVLRIERVAAGHAPGESPVRWSAGTTVRYQQQR